MKNSTFPFPFPFPFPGLILAALAVSLFSITTLSGCDNPPDTIKIGVPMPLSGTFAATGQDSLNGVKLAVAEINKEGFKIKGKPVSIEIMAMDDRSDPATAEEVAKQLVEAGVVAVIGHFNSSTSIAAAPIYAEKNIAQLAISSDPKFTQLGLATTYRLNASNTLQAKAMGSFAVNQLKAAKFAVVDDGTPVGKGLADGAAEELKAHKKEITIRQSFDLKTAAFDELAGKLKAGNVEVVISTLSDWQVLALLDALKKVGFTSVSILGSNLYKTVTMLKGVGMVRGLYATSPTLEIKEFLTGPQFLAKYREAFKIEPVYGPHYNYDAMYVLAAALKRAESASPEKITETLRTLDGYGPVTGSMKWDAVGERLYAAIGVYSARADSWELQMRSDKW